MKKISFLVFVAFFSVIAYGQLFTPLGLGIEKCTQNCSLSTPQMHVEGDILYVCTSQGLYSKDLSNEESTWQLVGFEGVPLQDYVRRGDDILALRNNIGGNVLLLSRDGGKTYGDVTPDLFKEQHAGWTDVLTSLVQHPEDPNTLLVLSRPMGLYQSSDFGQTWNKLTEITSDHIGYHPLNPQIIYESGESYSFSPETYISYDGGQTWEDHSPYYPGDNSVSRVAFHPTDPNRWIATGCGAVYVSTENGHTWNTQDFMGDVQRFVFWRFIAYDNENSDILYVAGWAKDKIEVMCSADGGMTWSVPQTEPMKKSSLETVNDFQQYGGKLLVYTESDVYEISKAELLAQTVSTTKEPITFTEGQMATIVLPTEPEASKGKYYRLDRVEGREIIFEQELQPHAHVPYIIVPGEDFSIDLSTLDVEGLSNDTVTVDGVSFIGSYFSQELPALKGGEGGGSSYIQIIDTTPDCRPSSSGEGLGEGAFIGALRAYLTWDDPIDHGGAKTPPEKMTVVLRDHGTGMKTLSNSPLKGEDIFDLSGRKIVNGQWSIVNGQLPRGIYIENGKKKVMRE